MDQSDIEQLTAIFAKLGYDISITKRKANETEQKKEEIIPKKLKTDEKKDEKKDDEEFKCVPIYMPVPIKDNKCLCRLEKKGIPTQCTGIRLKGKKVCTRHNKKMSGWGFYDDDEPPERTSDGKLISWKFTTKKVAVEKKEEPKKDSETNVMTAVKPTKNVTIKDMFGSDSEEEDKKTPVKKMTNSKHEELMKSLEEITSDESDESDESDDDEADEYNNFIKSNKSFAGKHSVIDVSKKSGNKDDLIMEDKIIDGVKYTYCLPTPKQVPIVWGFVMYNEEQENVGTWNKELEKMEWKSDKFRDEHIYHADYIKPN